MNHKPCPFGCPDSDSVSIDSDFNSLFGWIYFVSCDACGARGPREPSRVEAWEAWDTREQEHGILRNIEGAEAVCKPDPDKAETGQVSAKSAAPHTEEMGKEG